jgi:hypothetical protein
MMARIRLAEAAPHTDQPISLAKCKCNGLFCLQDSRTLPTMPSRDVDDEVSCRNWKSIPSLSPPSTMRS